MVEINFRKMTESEINNIKFKAQKELDRRTDKEQECIVVECGMAECWFEHKDAKKAYDLMKHIIKERERDLSSDPNYIRVVNLSIFTKVRKEKDLELLLEKTTKILKENWGIEW